ncbi:MAG TPA: Gfo/Idh/MocA family oxidoreductase [Acidimicrobiales bacterium]|nr:Gfo/Idh/MocA family oxidoreductase [Acidimicrobiales bacterium]
MATAQGGHLSNETAVRVGLVGCGKISQAYLTANYPNVTYTACADIDEARAGATAEAYGLEPMPVEQLLSDGNIQVVCNLTVPGAHAEISLAALERGKHVYAEKPFGLDREEGAAQLALADEKGLAVGCAPDTFLGAGLQTCRRLIDEGKIGEPIAAMANMVSHGPEHWHPDPAFFYRRGGGPLFDMGPYYLTALVTLIGPISRVSGLWSGVGTERRIRSGPRANEVLHVDIPTHVTGLLEFDNGAIGTIVTSFDVWGSALPRLEIHGTEASLSLPDPNTFGGPVRLLPAGTREWEEVPIDGLAVHTRGIGLSNLAASLDGTGFNRASGRLAYHVLDAMVSLIESGETGKQVDLTSSVERPPAMA